MPMGHSAGPLPFRCALWLLQGPPGRSPLRHSRELSVHFEDPWIISRTALTVSATHGPIRAARTVDHSRKPLGRSAAQEFTGHFRKSKATPMPLRAMAENLGPPKNPSAHIRDRAGYSYNLPAVSGPPEPSRAHDRLFRNF